MKGNITGASSTYIPISDVICHWWGLHFYESILHYTLYFDFSSITSSILDSSVSDILTVCPSNLWKLYIYVFNFICFSAYVLCSIFGFLYLFPISVTPCWCEIRYKQCENERIAAEESSRKLGQQIAEKEVQNSSIEGDLRIEREWRTSLQETVVKDRDKISQLHQELSQLKSVASVSLFIFF